VFIEEEVFRVELPKRRSAVASSAWKRKSELDS
jgi:hypothetical protein